MRVPVLQRKAQGLKGCAGYGHPAGVVFGVVDGGRLFEWYVLGGFLLKT